MEWSDKELRTEQKMHELPKFELTSEERQKMFAGIQNRITSQKKLRVMKFAVGGAAAVAAAALLAVGLLNNNLLSPHISAVNPPNHTEAGNTNQSGNNNPTGNTNQSKQETPDASSFNTWVEQTSIQTKMPVLVPNLWLHPNFGNHYYQAVSSADSYTVTAYQVEIPVPVNDEKAVLEKNGPLSESKRLASISGERIKDKSAPPTVSIPQGAQPFELIPGVTAYKQDNGFHVVWKQGNWGFEYTGSSDPKGNPVVLEDLRSYSRWQNKFVRLGESGKVTVTERNTSITWDKYGFRYNIQFKTGYEFAATLLDLP